MLYQYENARFNIRMSALYTLMRRTSVKAYTYLEASDGLPIFTTSAAANIAKQSMLLDTTSSSSDFTSKPFPVMISIRVFSQGALIIVSSGLKMTHTKVGRVTG